jgi:hypothetical protein
VLGLFQTSRYSCAERIKSNEDLYNRLSKFIDKYKILSKHQYGFRKNRSTEHALIDFTDKITKAIDEGKYSIGIFLDLSKASQGAEKYDCVYLKYLVIILYIA